MMRHFFGQKAHSTLNRNKRIVRRYYDEVLNQRDLTHISDIFSPAFLSYPKTDLSTYLNIVGMTHHAFPDLQVTIDQQIAEQDLVATRWHATATQQGSYFGIPPTGKHIVVAAMHFHRLADGKLIEHWEQFDVLGALQQLGVAALSIST